MNFRGAARRLVLPVVLVALALVVLPGAGPASAHAFLVSSNPADGQVLDTAPTVLRLRLSEPVLLGSTSVTVVGGSVRHEVTDLRLVTSGPDGSAPGGPGSASRTTPGGPGADEAAVELVGALPPLARGSYRVSLETVSGDDLHRTAAVLVFGVREQVAAAGRQETAPRPDEAVLRWVVLAGMCLGLGSGLVRRLARPARWRGVVAVTTSADQVAAAACGVSALTAVALLAVQLAGQGAAGLEALQGEYGARWLVREAGLLALAVAAAARWRGARRSGLVAFGVGAVLAPLGESLLGHAGAGSSTSWTRVVATALHIGAAGTWAGAAVLLTGCTLVLRREGVPGRAHARALLRRFGVPAAACLSVMSVTGIVLAGDVVASVDAVLVTDYGRVLLAKTLLTGVALVLGLSHARRLHPRLRLRPGLAATASCTPGRSLVVEAAAALVVLGLAGALAAGQPAVGPALVTDPGASFDPTVSAFADDLQEQLSIQPNRPGPNIAVVTVSSTRRPDPAPVTSVTVAVYAPGGGLRSAGTGERSAPGQWSVPVTMTEAGRAGAVVTVTRAGMAPVVLPVDWVVEQATPPRPLVSLAALHGRLRGTAVALGALLCLLWVVGLVRWWRRRTPASTPDSGVLHGADLRGPDRNGLSVPLR